MIGLVKKNGWWVSAGLAATLAASLPAAAQQAKPKISVEERIGKIYGPIIVRAAFLEGANEDLQAIVEQRDRTIAELQAQIAELKKAAQQ